MRSPIGLAAILVFACAFQADAKLIVSLDPATARFDSLTDNDDGANGYGAGGPSAAEEAAGLTFNATFTPAAGDLDSTTAAVNVLEIGGDANGSGLYLLGGEVHFISKMNGGGSDTLGSFDDLNMASGNNMIGVKSSFGDLTAGTEYSVAVIFDPITSATLQIGVWPTGGYLVQDSFNLSGVGGKTNWHGDNSATALRAGNIGNFGGANQLAAGADPFSEAGMNGNPFEGTAGQALYWSANSFMVIPEPSTLLIWSLLAGLGVSLRWRRRK